MASQRLATCSALETLSHMNEPNGEYIQKTQVNLVYITTDHIVGLKL